MTVREGIAQAAAREYKSASADRLAAMQEAVEASRLLVARLEGNVSDIEEMDELLNDVIDAVNKASRETVRRDDAETRLQALEDLRDARSES